MLQQFDAAADWIEKAKSTSTIFTVPHLSGSGTEELRSTPRGAGLMRKLNLAEA